MEYRKFSGYGVGVFFGLAQGVLSVGLGFEICAGGAGQASLLIRHVDSVTPKVGECVRGRSSYFSYAHVHGVLGALGAEARLKKNPKAQERVLAQQELLLQACSAEIALVWERGAKPEEIFRFFGLGKDVSKENYRAQEKKLREHLEKTNFLPKGLFPTVEAFMELGRQLESGSVLGIVETAAMNGESAQKPKESVADANKAPDEYKSEQIAQADQGLKQEAEEKNSASIQGIVQVCAPNTPNTPDTLEAILNPEPLSSAKSEESAQLSKRYLRRDEPMFKEQEEAVVDSRRMDALLEKMERVKTFLERTEQKIEKFRKPL